MHLYLHDYSFRDQLTDTLTGSMSLTAATFASVLVASQLKTQLQVFAQVSMVQAVLLSMPSLGNAGPCCVSRAIALNTFHEQSCFGSVSFPPAGVVPCK